MTYNYKPKGVCARGMDIDIEDGIVKNVVIHGGCDGNGKGVSALVKDMPAKEIISRIRGIKCGRKETSCPDQLATALEQILAEEEK